MGSMVRPSSAALVLVLLMLTYSLCLCCQVRAARSMELVAQRRRVEKHMSAQSKAVREQLAGLNDNVLQLRNSVESWVAKIKSYERLLANALSLKGIDIIWREAQALKAKQEKQLQEHIGQIDKKVTSSCAAVVAANREFESQELKSLEEGGKYAPQNVPTYLAGIAGIDHHITQQQQSQQQQLAAVQQELSAALNSALASIEQLLPSHKQDMTLIETLNKFVEGAKKRASMELSRNSQEGEAIGTTLQQLHDAVARAANQQAAANVPAPAVDGAAAPPGDPVALEQCQALLSTVDRLRQQVLRQAQVLELLQSTGVTNTTISLKISAELQPLPLPDSDTDGAAAPTAASEATAAGKGAAVRPTTGQKGGRPGTSGGTCILSYGLNRRLSVRQALGKGAVLPSLLLMKNLLLLSTLSTTCRPQSTPTTKCTATTRRFTREGCPTRPPSSGQRHCQRCSRGCTGH
eukprot:GHUV01031582.1.p1 GENE.GHUV01031582.1~~GHUV01031582.1.p1  ORF type:complete len:464 (+),score=143.61 GHUV01031582.1:61-1452(+)